MTDGFTAEAPRPEVLRTLATSPTPTFPRPESNHLPHRTRARRLLKASEEDMASQLETVSAFVEGAPPGEVAMSLFLLVDGGPLLTLV